MPYMETRFRQRAEAICIIRINLRCDELENLFDYTGS